MRNFIETETHRQCCAKRCKKMVRKRKDELVLPEGLKMFGGHIASLCRKHAKRLSPPSRA